MLEWLQTPLGGGLLWVGLHSADWFLTILGARKRKLRAAEVIQTAGSYELNPLFQKVVDQGRWWSGRFGFTLALGAVLFAALNLGVGVVRDPTQVLAMTRDGLLGGLVFTRAVIIARHLQNVWMFGRMASDPEAVTGQIRYARAFMHQTSAFQFAAFGVIIGVAAVSSPTPFLLGGAAMCLLLAAVGWLQSLRTPRQVAQP